MDLKDFINEALINEAKRDILLAWNIQNDTLYIRVGSSEDIKNHKETIEDFTVSKTPIDGNMVNIMWNDESCQVTPLKGNTWNAVKNNDIKKIEGFLKDRSDNYVYIESDIFGSGNEWYDEDAEKTKNWNSKKWLNHFISMVEDSYVDGDSNYCRAVVDLSKKEICCKGENEIVILDV